MRRSVLLLAIVAAAIAGCRDTYDSVNPIEPTKTMQSKKSFDGIVYIGDDQRIDRADDDGSHVKSIVDPIAMPTYRSIMGVGEDRLLYRDINYGTQVLAYYAVDLDGKEQQLIRRTVGDSSSVPFVDDVADISPDGGKVVYFTVGLGEGDNGGPDLTRRLYIHIVDSRNPSASHPTVQVGGDRAHHVAFSPDGDKIAFITSDNGWSLKEIGADGTGLRTIGTVNGFGTGYDIWWSPDGGKIAVAPYSPSGAAIDVFTVSSGNRSTIAVGGGTIWSLSWSHDGARIAYVQDETGSAGYARRLWITDMSGATSAVTDRDIRIAYGAWSPDGTKILLQGAPQGGLRRIGFYDVADGTVTWAINGAGASGHWIP